MHDDHWVQVGDRLDCQQKYQEDEHLLSLNTPPLLNPECTPPGKVHFPNNATAQLSLSVGASSAKKIHRNITSLIKFLRSNYENITINQKNKWIIA